MNIIAVLVTVIVGLVGLFLGQKRKADDASALNDNSKVKDALNEIDKIISKNDGQLDSEEQKRQELQKDAEEKKHVDESSDDLLRYINGNNGSNETH